MNSFVNVIVGVTFVFYLSWKLTLVMLSVVPFVAITGRKYGMYYRKQSKITQDLLAEATDVAQESISNIRTIKSFSKENEQEYMYAKAIHSTYIQGKIMALAFGGFSGFIGVMANLAVGLVLWYGSHLVINSHMSTGELGTYLMVTLNIGFSMGRFVALYSSLMKALGAGERTFSLIDRISNILPYGGRDKVVAGDTIYDYCNPDTILNKRKNSEVNHENGSVNGKQNGDMLMEQINNNNNNISVGINFRSKLIDDSDMKEFKGLLSVNDVDFAYPSRPGINVLNKLNMHVEPGKITALVGESGGGKSTVFSLLMRFYDPLNGNITIDGVDLKDFNLQWIHSKIGYVSQEPVLFSRSIKDNIIFGMDRLGEDNIDMAKIIDATKKANAYEFIDKFPNKFDTLVGERGIRLSGGQKQRIAIARAILMDPKILYVYILIWNIIILYIIVMYIGT